jgi:hypothetical protein
MKKMVIPFLILIILGLEPASAQYQVQKGSLTSGIGSSGNSEYTLHSNIGPLVIGQSDGGSYRLLSGPLYGEHFPIEAISGAGGSVNPSGISSVRQGFDIEFEIKPSVGFLIGEVLVDAVPMGKISRYKFNNISSAHRIEATFEQAETLPPFPADMLLWLDVRDILPGEEPSGADKIAGWQDKTANTPGAAMTAGERQPSYMPDGMLGYPGVSFECDYEPTHYGYSDIMSIGYNEAISSGNDEQWDPDNPDKPALSKSIVMVFKTGELIDLGGNPSYYSDGRQMLFELGGPLSGMNTYIAEGKLCFGAWNRFESAFSIFDPPNSGGYFGLGPGKLYALILSFDADGDMLSAAVGDEYGNVDLMPFGIKFHGITRDASDATGLGGATRTRYHDYSTGETYSDHFCGTIGDLIIYKRAINGAIGLPELLNYLGGRYGIAFSQPAQFAKRINAWHTIHTVAIDGELLIAPNPAEDYIEISGINPDISSLRVINALGETSALLSDNIPGGMRIQIGNLPAGLYFIELNDGDRIRRGRFVKL